MVGTAEGAYSIHNKKQTNQWGRVLWFGAGEKG